MGQAGKSISMLFRLVLVLVASASVSSLSTGEYTVDDIVQRYRNLTRASREVSLFAEQPQYDTSCVKAAIMPILSKCLKTPLNEMDPKIRAMTAAKLSVCEFEVANVEYPLECRSRGRVLATVMDPTEYSACVMALEKKSQWWTTYSGYYRSIGELCHQESLPYEKDEIWSMFLGVTSYYSEVFDSLHDCVEVSRRLKRESEESLAQLRRFMAQVERECGESKHQLQTMWSHVTSQMSKMGEMSANVTALARQSSEAVESNLVSFFEDIDLEFSRQLDLLRLRFVTDLEERDMLMAQSLEETSNGLQRLYSQLLRTVDVHRELDASLEGASRSAHHLNGSLSKMDHHVDDLTAGMVEAKELMVDITDLLETSPVLRAVLYLSSGLTTSLQGSLAFLVMTSVAFLLLVMLSLRVNVLKYIGILVLSGVFGLIIVTVEQAARL